MSVIPEAAVEAARVEAYESALRCNTVHEVVRSRFYVRCGEHGVGEGGFDGCPVAVTAARVEAAALAAAAPEIERDAKVAALREAADWLWDDSDDGPYTELRARADELEATS